MFNFRKKKDDSEEEDDITEIDNEEIQINNDVNINSLLSELEYTNSYLAQISMSLNELTKQQTIANALHILDSEYNNADSIMDVEEILQKKYALFGSIFVDYQARQENVEENE